jgi:hypothetical protein
MQTKDDPEMELFRIQHDNLSAKKPSIDVAENVSTAEAYFALGMLICTEQQAEIERLRAALTEIQENAGSLPEAQSIAIDALKR